MSNRSLYLYNDKSFYRILKISFSKISEGIEILYENLILSAILMIKKNFFECIKQKKNAKKTTNPCLTRIIKSKDISCLFWHIFKLPLLYIIYNPFRALFFFYINSIRLMLIARDFEKCVETCNTTMFTFPLICHRGFALSIFSFLL